MHPLQGGVASKTKDGWTHTLRTLDPDDYITRHCLGHLREFNDAISSRATKNINGIDGERIGIVEHDARLCQTKQARRTASNAVGISRGDNNLPWY